VGRLAPAELPGRQREGNPHPTPVTRDAQDESDFSNTHEHSQLSWKVRDKTYNVRCPAPFIHQLFPYILDIKQPAACGTLHSRSLKVASEVKSHIKSCFTAFLHVLNVCLYCPSVLCVIF